MRCKILVCGRRFVEGMLYLNHLHVYGREGDWVRTVCVGKSLDDIAEIENLFRFNRRNGYRSVSVWDLGFGGIFSESTEKDLHTNSTDGSELHFFDWECNPIARVRLSLSVKEIELDTEREILLAIADDDELKTYNIIGLLPLN